MNEEYDEYVAKENGFENAKEMHKIISDIPIKNGGDLLDFEYWKKYDGTKEGAMKLIKKYKEDV